MIDLNTIWYVLTGVLFTGYAMLDGFDLGVGVLHLFTKNDRNRRFMLNAIGPVWDGNEVWLVTGGGALFAAFPEVYATAFSGFYIAFMLLLASLIFRAVAIEFRSREPWAWWRKLWDIGFAAGSTGSAFLIGVAMGNVIQGVPLNASHEYVGSFFDLLTPYALASGVVTVALFAMHGAIYIVMKTDGELQKQARSWVNHCIGIFLFCFVVFNMVTLVHCPAVTGVVKSRPWTFFLLLLTMLVAANIPREIFLGRELRAFVSSCLVIVCMMTLFGATLYPNMIIASNDVANSLNIYNGASSQRTLTNMLIIAIMGMPVVIAYTISIYWIFRGKVKLTEESY